MGPCVLLIHGLGESALRMSLIALSLRTQGYRTVNITYPSTSFPTQQLAEDFVMPVLRNLENEKKLHVVTHSLGGIVLRTCLETKKQKNLGRVVMLAPANEGSKLMDIYRRNPLFALLSGPVAQESGIGEHCFPCKLHDEVSYDLGIIAGSIPIDIFSFLSLNWPQDGRTTMQSTKLQGMKDHIILPTSHEFITFNPLAIYQTWHFLEHGYFKAGIAWQAI